jgi:hypothetical protein
MDESFSADLSSWLNATSDRYVVSEVLKDSADEVTQVVYRRDENGNASVGPFVRKRFAQDGSRGKAYRSFCRHKHWAGGSSINPSSTNASRPAAHSRL